MSCKKDEDTFRYWNTCLIGSTLFWKFLYARENLDEIEARDCRNFKSPSIVIVLQTTPSESSRKPDYHPVPLNHCHSFVHVSSHSHTHSTSTRTSLARTLHTQPVQFERIEGDVRRHNSVVTVATHGLICSGKREIGMPKSYITDPNRFFRWNVENEIWNGCTLSMYITFRRAN